MSAPLKDGRGSSLVSTDNRAGVVLSPDQVNRLIREASKGPMGLRNTALLMVLLGTGLGLNGLHALRVADFLHRDGSVRPKAAVDGRHLLWSSRKVIAAIEAYLSARARHGMPSEYRGFHPDAPLFLADDGKPIRKQLKTVNGKQYETNDHVSEILCGIFDRAKVQGSPVRSARLTLASRMVLLGAADADMIRVLGVRRTSLPRRARRVAPRPSAEKITAEVV